MEKYIVYTHQKENKDMNILVCVKYALDVTELKIDQSSKTPIFQGVPRKISDIDKNAVEEAVVLKEKHGGKVVTITFGPKDAKNGLKETLAIGADEAYLIEDPSNGQLDTRATSTVLAAGIKKLGSFDLIICGEATVDGFSSQVGPRLAERLNVPLLSYAKKVTVNGDEVVAERDLEDQYETLKTKFPALISVTREINTPRIPPLMAILKAAKKKSEIWQIEDLGLSAEELSKTGSSIKITAIQPLESKRKGVIIKDKPAAETAEELVNMLIKDKCLG